MKTCTYDNPATMARECWQDGELLYAYSYLILAPYAREPIPRGYFFLGAAVGPWNAGKLYGNADAMNEVKKESEL